MGGRPWGPLHRPPGMRSRVLQSTPEGSSQAGGHGHYLKSQVKTTDPHFPTPQLGDHLSHSPEASGFYYSPTRKTPVGAAVAGGRSWAQDRLDGEGPESNAGPTPGRSPRAGSLPGALSWGEPGAGTACGFLMNGHKGHQITPQKGHLGQPLPHHPQRPREF